MSSEALLQLLLLVTCRSSLSDCLLGKKRFTEAPLCETIDVRMLEELVPQLLPPTEITDVEALEVINFWTPFKMGRAGVSPLGLIVPHRMKHRDTMGIPFDLGQICHVGGKLCEVIDRTWDSQKAQDEGIAASKVTVRFIESEPIASTRVLSLAKLHVPAVERFTGFLDGDEEQSCEITWVSKDRTKVRVRFTSDQRKRFASSKIEKTMSSAPSWVQTAVSGDDEEMQRLAEEYYTPEEEEERNNAAMKMQAHARGYLLREDLEMQKELQDTKAANQFKKGGEKEKTFDSDKVKKVTMEGDEQWMNRLVVELGIRQQEAIDGFRYLPPNVSITDKKGRFIPLVVGLRALSDGTFVQDVEVGFHELLLALCLIPSSYDGLNFDEKQQKYTRMRELAEDYAARVFQCCARCKMAKRHLLVTVMHFDESKRPDARAKTSWDDDDAYNGSSSYDDDDGNQKFQNPILDDVGDDDDATGTGISPRSPSPVTMTDALDMTVLVVRTGPIPSWKVSSLAQSVVACHVWVFHWRNLSLLAMYGSVLTGCLVRTFYRNSISSLGRSIIGRPRKRGSAL